MKEEWVNPQEFLSQYFDIKLKGNLWCPFHIIFISLLKNATITLSLIPHHNNSSISRSRSFIIAFHRLSLFIIHFYLSKSFIIVFNHFSSFSLHTPFKKSLWPFILQINYSFLEVNNSFQFNSKFILFYFHIKSIQ